VGGAGENKLRFTAPPASFRCTAPGENLAV
jgi:hypothetical protein